MVTLDKLIFELKTDSSGVQYYAVKAANEQITGDIVIPSDYEGLPVKEVAEFGFLGCNQITSVVLPDSITEIKAQSFKDCTSIASINIPNGVTVIEDHAFHCCQALTMINVPGTVLTIGESAFDECINLEYAILYEGLEIISNTAFRATNIKRLVIPASVSHIGSGIVANCNNLQTITIKGNPSNVSVTAFSPNSINPVIKVYASQGYTVDSIIGGLPVELIAEASPIAPVTETLEKLVFTLVNDTEEGDYYSVSAAVGASGECVIPEMYEGSPVKKMAEGFGKFTSVYIPRSIATIEWNAFGVNEGEAIIETVTFAEDAAVTTFTSNLFVNKKYLSSINFPKNLEYINMSCFSGCESLTSVKFPASLISISANAFLNCINLTNVEFEMNESQLTHIYNGAFQGCSLLEEVILPPSIKYFNFYGCTGLKNLVITGNNITNIYGSALAYCTNLQTINIPSSVTAIDSNAFLGSGIKSIVIPHNVSFIGTTIFAYCSNLEEISVNTENENFYSIGNCIIESATDILVCGCKNSKISSRVKKIGDYSFYHCDALEKITIPNSVHTIGNYAFYACVLLEAIVIPASVTAIYKGVFQGCESLSYVLINGHPEVDDSSSGAIDYNYGPFYNTASLSKINVYSDLGYVEGDTISGKELLIIPGSPLVFKLNLGDIHVSAVYLGDIPITNMLFGQ